MRRAVLYTLNKQMVTVMGDYIPYNISPDRVLRSFNSGEMLVTDDHIKRVNLPVERWVMDDENHYVAFDPLLRDIIDIKISEAESGVRSRMGKFINMADEEIARLYSEIKQLQERTIWDMIKLKFKRRSK